MLNHPYMIPDPLDVRAFSEHRAPGLCKALMALMSHTETRLIHTKHLSNSCILHEN